MADKMMRMSARGEDGTSKALQAKNDGRLKIFNDKGYIHGVNQVTLAGNSEYRFMSRDVDLFNNVDEFNFTMKLDRMTDVTVSVDYYHVVNGSFTLIEYGVELESGFLEEVSKVVKVKGNSVRIRVRNNSSEETTIIHAFAKENIKNNSVIKVIKNKNLEPFKPGKNFALIDRSEYLQDYRSLEVFILFENNFRSRVILADYYVDSEDVFLIDPGRLIGISKERKSFHEVFDVKANRIRIRLYNDSSETQKIIYAHVKGVF